MPRILLALVLAVAPALPVPASAGSDSPFVFNPGYIHGARPAAPRWPAHAPSTRWCWAPGHWRHVWVPQAGWVLHWVPGRHVAC